MRAKAIAAYSALSLGSQSRFLAELAYEITVWARYAYPASTDSHPRSAERLAAYNELQHQVSAHLVHLLNGNHLRYPDDVFINILFDESGPAECGDQLGKLFGDPFAAYQWSHTDADGAA